MIDLLPSPCDAAFESIVGDARDNLFLCAPYVGKGPCERVRRLAGNCRTVTLLCDLSRDNLLTGATDAAAIAALCQARSGVTVRFLPTLHAKSYIADDRSAIVTSANLTESGLLRNLEYGVRVSEPSIVRQIRGHISAYGDLGSVVPIGDLVKLAAVAAELADVRRTAERSIRSQLQSEFNKRLEAATVEVIRIRAAGRAPHTIFGEAIRYLLANGPMTTVELHRRIQSIHPDLCDDTVDRVIDGKSFGKKWKHAVRTAQQYLKKHGEVSFDGTRWMLVPTRSSQ